MNLQRDDIIRHCLRGIVSALLLAASMLTAHAQQSILKFDRISTEQGLSDNYVTGMLQDHLGLIWFATRDGLNRYDGYTFTVYGSNIHDPGSISDGGVDCMAEDREGRLWLGSHGGGLNRFDRATGRFTHYVNNPSNPESIPPGPISSICEQGRYIWLVATGPESTLCRLDKATGRTKRYPHSATNPSSISSDNVTSVVCDASGTVWAGTGNAGLNRFDPASGGFINGNSNPLYAVRSTGQIVKLSAGGDGKLYLWSYTCVRWLDLNAAISGNTIDSMNNFRMGRVQAVYRDRTGTLWIGGSNNGAGIMKRGEHDITYIMPNGYDPYSLGSERIFCIMEDRSGNIWLGTDNGVSKFNSRNWHPQYYQYDPLDSNRISQGVVRSITKDREGNIWIALERSGVNRIAASTGVVTRYQYSKSDPRTINDLTANVVYVDSRDQLWVATNHGLARFDKRTGRFHRYESGPPDGAHLPNTSTWSILEDSRGTLWVGTFGGLCMLDRATDGFRYISLNHGGPEGPPDNIILCLYESRDGNLWAGTEKGLSMLDRSTNTWQHFEHHSYDTSSLVNNRVWYIHEDGQGIFWLATSGGGVDRFDRRTERFSHYTEREGLASNMACGILEDTRGRLWISTTKGISMLDPATRKLRTYGLQDGFYVHEFHFKSCYKDDKGYFYFGGTNGIIRFHPDSIGDNYHVPNIMLTSFKVFNHERILDASGAEQEEIRLDHDSNFFSFSFAALDYTNSRRNQYLYSLEGVDDDWREASGDYPRADYTNVPPGRHIFRVRGSNSDGTWNQQGVALAVNITPAFWQTWWFKPALLALACALAAALVRARIRNVRRQGVLERKTVEYQLKALRAQMNPHFIFNSLNSILLFILDHDIDAAHRYLTTFSRLMRSTLEHSKSESVPLAEELETLGCYIELEALRLDNAFSYTIEVAPGIDAANAMIPPMLIQPYVENAIKHGLKPAGLGGMLSIRIGLDHESIVCSITDNGIGRTASQQAARDGTHRPRGMGVTRERLDILGSLSRQCYGLEVIDLTGTEGAPAGTRVNIRIPIARHLDQLETNNEHRHDTRDYR